MSSREAREVFALWRSFYLRGVQVSCRLGRWVDADLDDNQQRAFDALCDRMSQPDAEWVAIEIGRFETPEAVNTRIRSVARARQERGNGE